MGVRADHRRADSPAGWAAGLHPTDCRLDTLSAAVEEGRYDELGPDTMTNLDLFHQTNVDNDAGVDVFLRRDAGSLAQQIYAQIRDAILDGDLATGTRLTPSRELAAELGVSRFTVTEAYGRLAAEGYVHGERGRGSVVAPAADPSGDRRGRGRARSR